MAKANQGMGKEIGADAGQSTESFRTSNWVYQPDLSRTPANAGQAMLAFSAVSTFFFKPGADMSECEDAIKPANAAAKKSHWPGKPANWYYLENGDFPPALAVTTDQAKRDLVLPPGLARSAFSELQFR